MICTLKFWNIVIQNDLSHRRGYEGDWLCLRQYGPYQLRKVQMETRILLPLSSLWFWCNYRCCSSRSACTFVGSSCMPFQWWLHMSKCWRASLWNRYDHRLMSFFRRRRSWVQTANGQIWVQDVNLFFRMNFNWDPISAGVKREYVFNHVDGNWEFHVMIVCLYIHKDNAKKRQKVRTSSPAALTRIDSLENPGTSVTS